MIQALSIGLPEVQQEALAEEKEETQEQKEEMELLVREENRPIPHMPEAVAAQLEAVDFQTGINLTHRQLVEAVAPEDITPAQTHFQKMGRKAHPDM